MKSKAILAVAFWALFIVLDLFKKSIWERDEGLILYFYLPGLLLWFVLTNPLIRFSEWVFTQKQRTGVITLAALGLSIGLLKTVLELSIQWSADSEIGGSWVSFILEARPVFFIENVIVTWVFVGFMLIFEFYKKYTSKSQLAAELESELTKAHLQALRIQLEPHFLFNTLNTITTLVKSDRKKEALATLNGFSLLMRSVLNDKKPLVLLEEEILLIKQYLDIESIRFKDRLTVEYDIPEECLRARLPGLILQPIAENAIKHGIARFMGEGKIKVRAAVLESVLTIEVFNSTPMTMIAEPLENNQEGIGLENVRKRLNKIYSHKALFDISHKSDGVLVRLAIPQVYESL